MSRREARKEYRSRSRDGERVQCRECGVYANIGEIDATSLDICLTCQLEQGFQVSCMVCGRFVRTHGLKQEICEACEEEAGAIEKAHHAELDVI